MGIRERRAGKLEGNWREGGRNSCNFISPTFYQSPFLSYLDLALHSLRCQSSSSEKRKHSIHWFHKDRHRRAGMQAGREGGKKSIF